MRQLLKQFILLITLIRPAVSKYMAESEKPVTDDPLWNLKKACDYLAMSEKTLWRKRKAKLIAEINLGGHPFFYLSELKRYKNANHMK